RAAGSALSRHLGFEFSAESLRHVATRQGLWRECRHGKPADLFLFCDRKLSGPAKLGIPSDGAREEPAARAGREPLNDTHLPRASMERGMRPAWAREGSPFPSELRSDIPFGMTTDELLEF